MPSFDVPVNLADQSERELRQHAVAWARQAADQALTFDERIDLAIQVRVALQLGTASAPADARFVLWSEAFGVAVEDVDRAIDRWTRRANSC